jgi:hypothetical protein
MARGAPGEEAARDAPCSTMPRFPRPTEAFPEPYLKANFGGPIKSFG